MVQVDVYVRSIGESSFRDITKTSFLAEQPITKADLDKYMVFKGKFHYRYKRNEGDDFVWVDLVAPSDVILYPHQSFYPLEVQAMMMFNDIDDSIDDDYNEYFLDIALQLQEEGPRAERQCVDPTALSFTNMKPASRTVFTKMKNGMTKALEKAHVEQISMTAVAKGAASLWKTMISGASQILGIPTPLSDAAEGVLAALSDDADAGFDDSETRHLEILKDLWRYLFSNQQPFERHSEKWKSVGFQSENPVLDLKNSGVLSLMCLGYMSHKYKTEARRMIARNEKNVQVNYPFAVVAVDICMLLIDILNLRDSKYLSTQAGYW